MIIIKRDDNIFDVHPNLNTEFDIEFWMGRISRNKRPGRLIFRSNK